jgi:serine/threonine protein kinase
MERGTIIDYICTHEYKDNTDYRRRTLVCVPLIYDKQNVFNLWRKITDIATGIEYLHTQGIAHGDLRGVCNFQ